MGNPAAGEFKPGEQIPEVAEKWARCLRLRMAGASYDEIARQEKYASASGAFQAVRSAMDATLREPAESVRTLEADRLDRLMLGVWQRAVGGDAEAIAHVLKIMDRRARLLGLDAPTRAVVQSQAQVTISGGVTAQAGSELNEWREMMNASPSNIASASPTPPTSPTDTS